MGGGHATLSVDSQRRDLGRLQSLARWQTSKIAKDMEPPVTPALEPVRRIAAYGVCHDDAGRVLLVRAAPGSGTPGVWSLPGGAVDHGEHPHDTVVRETAAETGLSVALQQLRGVLADMRSLPGRGITIHTDRLVYDVRVRGGALRDRIGQPTDLARWCTLDEAADLKLRPF